MSKAQTNICEVGCVELNVITGDLLNIDLLDKFFVCISSHLLLIHLPSSLFTKSGKDNGILDGFFAYGQFTK